MQIFRNLAENGQKHLDENKPISAKRVDFIHQNFQQSPKNKPADFGVDDYEVWFYHLTPQGHLYIVQLYTTLYTNTKRV